MTANIFDAINQSDFAVATSLIQDKPSIVNLRNKDGQTPLHSVSGLKYIGDIPIELLQLMLDSGSSVDAQDNLGQTPISLAVRRGNQKVLDALIAAKADVNLPDSDGNSPLHWSIKFRCTWATYGLIDAGAKLYIPNHDKVLPEDYLVPPSSSLKQKRIEQEQSDLGKIGPMDLEKRTSRRPGP